MLPRVGDGGFGELVLMETFAFCDPPLRNFYEADILQNPQIFDNRFFGQEAERGNPLDGREGIFGALIVVTFEDVVDCEALGSDDGQETENAVVDCGKHNFPLAPR